MRIRELLNENYVEQVVSDTNTLIATLKSQGKTQISTESLVAQLMKMGHNVNVHSIMSVLEQCPFVTSFTPTTIELETEQDYEMNNDNASDSEETIEKMARGEAERDIKQGI